MCDRQLRHGVLRAASGRAGQCMFITYIFIVVATSVLIETGSALSSSRYSVHLHADLSTKMLRLEMHLRLLSPNQTLTACSCRFVRLCEGTLGTVQGFPVPSHRFAVILYL